MLEYNEYLQELHSQENAKMRRIAKIDHELKYTIPEQIRRLNKERKNLTKSISHNMRLRNKVINELTEINKIFDKHAQINKLIEEGKDIPADLSKDFITFPLSNHLK